MGLGQPETGNGIDPCGTIRSQEEVPPEIMGNHVIRRNRSLPPMIGENRVRATVYTFLPTVGSESVLSDDRGNPFIRRNGS
jgi:hypothetical protein